MAEYILLLLILVGVPLACAGLGGYDEVLRDVFTIVPQTDDWQSCPDRLWNCRRPFTWWAFFLVGGIGTALVAPFVWRSIRRRDALVASEMEGAYPFDAARVPRLRYPHWAWLGLAVMLLGWVLAWNRFPLFAPVQRWTYIPLWAGLIVAMNGLVRAQSAAGKRKGGDRRGSVGASFYGRSR